MVQYEGGGLFRPVQFDFTSGLRYLQEQDRIALEAAKTELARRQQQFDQEAELATRDARVRNLIAQADFSEARSREALQKEKLYSSLSGAVQGIQSRLTGGESLGELGAMVRGIQQPAFMGKLSKNIGVPGARIASAAGDVAKALFAPIGELLSNRLKMDMDPEVAGLAYGLGEEAETLGPLVDIDEADEAVRAHSKAVENSLRAVPTGDQLRDRIVRNPEMVLPKLAETIGELHRFEAGLGSPVFELDQYAGKKDELLLQAEELQRELSGQVASFRAAENIMTNRQARPLNPKQLNDTKQILKSQIEQLFNSANPFVAVEELSGRIASAGFYPDGSGVAEFVQGVVRTGDPVNTLTAAMMWESLIENRNLPGSNERALMRAEFASQPGLVEMLDAINMGRRTYGSAAQENLLSGLTDAPNPEESAALIEYSSMLMGRAERAIQEGDTRIEKEKQEQQGKDGVTDEDILINVGTDLLGEDGTGWLFDANGYGLMDDLDLNLQDLDEDTRERMIEEAVFHAAQYRSQIQDPDKRAASIREYVKGKMGTVWEKGWLGEAVTRYHPRHHAFAQLQQKMPNELAAEVARNQLRSEVLKKNNLELEDVAARPVLLYDKDTGKRVTAYEITSKENSDKVWASAWVPDYSLATLQDMTKATAKWSYEGKYGRREGDYRTSLAKDIEGYLGDQSPKGQIEFELKANEDRIRSQKRVIQNMKQNGRSTDVVEQRLQIMQEERKRLKEALREF